MTFDSSVEIGDYPGIAEQLTSMAETDQDIRFGTQGSWPEDYPGEKLHNIGREDVQKVDRANTTKLKKIIRKIGWPTIRHVGKEASYAAWLLVQHADQDPDFQEECLGLMEKAKEDVLPANIAYLTDRVAVNRHEPQVYGTQLHRGNDGKLIPRPIKNEEQVEERRKQMGLEPLSQYLKYTEGVFPADYVNPMIGRFYQAH